MCLGSRMTKEEQKKYADKKFGWKVVKKGKKRAIYPPYFSTRKALSHNRWLKEEDFRNGRTETIPYEWHAGRYPKGFHLYLTRKKARAEACCFGDRTAVKVFFRNPVAYGWQSGPCVVAKEIFIPKTKKEVHP